MAEGVAQIGEHASLVGPLDPHQARLMRHLAPESEPSAAGALVELLGPEIGVDDRLHPAARCRRELEALVDLIGYAPGQGPEGRLQQSVLVPEIVRDQPGGDAGSLGDLSERAADIADLRQAVDRDRDQLPAALLFRLLPPRRRISGFPAA